MDGLKSYMNFRISLKAFIHQKIRKGAWHKAIYLLFTQDIKTPDVCSISSPCSLTEIFSSLDAEKRRITLREQLNCERFNIIV
jgi:hypothetical protein